MTSIEDIHNEYVAAIDEGDIERALEAERQFQANNTSLPNLYQQLSTTIENEQYDQARTILRKIRERLDNVRREERVILQKALLARDKKNLDEDELETIENTVSQTGAASFERFSFFTELITFLSKPEVGNKSDTAQTAESMETTSQQVQSTIQSAKEVVDNYTLPPDVHILQVNGADKTYTPGTSFDLEIVVTNIGESIARNVTVSLATSSDLQISPKTNEIGNIASAGRASASFTITTGSQGTQPVQVRVNSDNTDISAREVSVNVSGADQAQSVVEAIADDGKVDRGDVIEAINLYYRDNPVPGTNGKEITRQDVIQIISIYYQGGDV